MAGGWDLLGIQGCNYQLSELLPTIIVTDRGPSLSLLSLLSLRPGAGGQTVPQCPGLWLPKPGPGRGERSSIVWSILIGWDHGVAEANSPMP